MNIFQNRWTQKMVAILLVLLFLIVSVTVFLSYRIATDRLKQQVTVTNMELLRQVNHKLELMMKGIDKETIRLLTSDEARLFFDSELPSDVDRTKNYREINGYIEGLVTNNPYVFSVDLYSYGKKQLLSGSILSEEDMPEDYQWIKQFVHYEGFSNWLPTRRLTIDSSNFPIYQNVTTLVRTYPLIHSAGFRRGAVAVNVKEASLYSLIKDPNDQSTDLTFVVDANGQIVIHPDKEKLGKDVSELRYITNVLQGENEGSFAASVNETDSSVFFVTSKYTGWKIVRVVPVVRLNQSLISIRNTLLAVAFALFLAAAIMVVFISRWTLKPINRFIYNMSKKLKSHYRYGDNTEHVDEFLYFESTVQHILNDSERLQRQIKEGKPFMKWRLLMGILTNYSVNYKDINQYMELVGIQLHGGSFVVMSMEFDNKKEIASPRDLHLYAYALCNIVEEIINAESKGAAIEREDGQCAILISFGEEEDVEKLAIRAVAVAELIKNCAQEYLKKTVTIGIGGTVHSMEDIHLSYKQSLEALKYKLIMGHNTIITADEIHESQFGEYHRLLPMTDNMIDSIKKLEADKLEEQVHRWFDSFAHHNVPPDMIKQFALQLLLKAAAVVNEIGLGSDELVPSRNLHEVLVQCERLDQIRDYVSATLTDFIRFIKSRRSNKDKNELIDKIIHYLQQRYMHSDLSLNVLADEFHMSVSHVSKMFKDYTGENFIDYLTEIRINKSKELLADQEMKVRDIAEAVGYTYVNSFIRIFKKVTGLTPSEYRDRERAKRDGQMTR